MITVSGLTKVYGLGPSEAAAALAGGDPAQRRAAVAAAGGVLGADDVSFAVGAQEMLVVAGPSGSGKSTLLRLLTRLVEPTRGAVRIAGRDVGDLDDAALERLRARSVFRRSALFEHRTVRENAAYGLRSLGLPRHERLARADAALDRVGLAGRADARPSQLSGAERERAGLARSLAAEPEVLLLDEPFAELDPALRAELHGLLAGLRCTTVLSTRDAGEAMSLGARVLAMRDGQAAMVNATGSAATGFPTTVYGIR